MLTSQVLETSARRRWARSAAVGTDDGDGDERDGGAEDDGVEQRREDSVGAGPGVGVEEPLEEPDVTRDGGLRRTGSRQAPIIALPPCADVAREPATARSG